MKAIIMKKVKTRKESQEILDHFSQEIKLTIYYEKIRMQKEDELLGCLTNLSASSKCDL